MVMSAEELSEDIRLTDDGILVLWGIIATRTFPTDTFGQQIVGAFRQHFINALNVFAAEQVTQALNLPDDPAQSIARMLAKMDEQDKQAFNFCIKTAITQARAEEREACAKIAESWAFNAESLDIASTVCRRIAAAIRCSEG